MAVITLVWIIFYRTLLIYVSVNFLSEFYSRIKNLIAINKNVRNVNYDRRRVNKNNTHTSSFVNLCTRNTSRKLKYVDINCVCSDASATTHGDLLTENYCKNNNNNNNNTVKKWKNSAEVKYYGCRWNRIGSSYHCSEGSNNGGTPKYKSSFYRSARLNYFPYKQQYQYHRQCRSRDIILRSVLNTQNNKKYKKHVILLSVLRLCRFYCCRYIKKDKFIRFEIVCCANCKIQFSPERFNTVCGCFIDTMGANKSRSSPDDELNTTAGKSTSSLGRNSRRFSFGIPGGKKVTSATTEESDIKSEEPKKRRFSLSSLSPKKQKKKLALVEKAELAKASSTTQLSVQPQIMRIESPVSVRKNDKELKILPPILPPPEHNNSNDELPLNDYEIIEYPKKTSVDFKQELLSSNNNVDRLNKAGEIAFKRRRNVDSDPDWTISRLLNYEPVDNKRTSTKNNIYATIEELSLNRYSSKHYEDDIYESIVVPRLLDSERTSYISDDSFHSAYENLPTPPTPITNTTNLPDKINEIIVQKYNLKEKPPRMKFLTTSTFEGDNAHKLKISPTSSEFSKNNSSKEDIIILKRQHPQQRVKTVESVDDIIREQHFSKHLSAYSISELLTPSTMNHNNDDFIFDQNEVTESKSHMSPSSPVNDLTTNVKCVDEPECLEFETKDIPKVVNNVNVNHVTSRHSEVIVKKDRFSGIAFPTVRSKIKAFEKTMPISEDGVTVRSRNHENVTLTSQKMAENLKQENVSGLKKKSLESNCEDNVLKETSFVNAEIINEQPITPVIALNSNADVESSRLKKYLREISQSSSIEDDVGTTTNCGENEKSESSLPPLPKTPPPNVDINYSKINTDNHEIVVQQVNDDVPPPIPASPCPEALNSIDKYFFSPQPSLFSEENITSGLMTEDDVTEEAIIIKSNLNDVKNDIDVLTSDNKVVSEDNEVNIEQTITASDKNVITENTSANVKTSTTHKDIKSLLRTFEENGKQKRSPSPAPRSKVQPPIASPRHVKSLLKAFEVKESKSPPQPRTQIPLKTEITSSPLTENHSQHEIETTPPAPSQIPQRIKTPRSLSPSQPHPATTTIQTIKKSKNHSNTQVPASYFYSKEVTNTNSDFWNEPYQPTSKTIPYNDQILRDIVLREKPEYVNSIDDIMNDETFSKRLSDYSLSDLLVDDTSPPQLPTTTPPLAINFDSDHTKSTTC